MSKDISTLTEDIYHVLDATEEHEPNADLATEYAMRVGGEFAKSTLQRNKPRQRGKLWASDLGKPCMRQHWYNFNQPEAGEPLMGHTKFKFLYGNILEEAVLYMAEEAGHEVKHQQHSVSWDIEREDGPDWKVSGRIDAIIDGKLIDVKSTSSFGFKRYKDGIDNTNDSFGYLYQLGFYKNLIDEDVDEECGFVWIDKQNGHIKYTSATTPDKGELERRARDIIENVEQEEVSSVDRGYLPEPYGKSGNECLPVSCSYCSYKKECWKGSNGGQGLRSFAYNHKPVHFTRIAREPKVAEITDATN